MDLQSSSLASADMHNRCSAANRRERQAEDGLAGGACDVQPEAGGECDVGADDDDGLQRRGTTSPSASRITRPPLRGSSHAS